MKKLKLSTKLFTLLLFSFSISIESTVTQTLNLRNSECDTSFGYVGRGCKLNNSTDINCSNRGQCICGVCECNRRQNREEVISGEFCECDNYSCERENGVICAGHGVCNCGLCQCERGWRGSACECSTDVSTCIDPLSGQICNGKGDCVCGKCVCESTLAVRNSGRFCEKCPSCPDRCYEFADCVQCRMHHTGRECVDQDYEMTKCMSFPQIQKVDVAESDEAIREKFCKVMDETDQCEFYFVYGYDVKGELYIKAQETKDCPSQPPIFVRGLIYLFSPLLSLLRAFKLS